MDLGKWAVARQIPDAVAVVANMDRELFFAFHGEVGRDTIFAIASMTKAITTAAADAGRAMLAGGIDIVVVSNSGTEKLQRWFAHADVPARVHPEAAPGELRLRGAARKFVLEDGPGRVLEVGEATIDVARPHYEAVLGEESDDELVRVPTIEISEEV